MNSRTGFAIVITLSLAFPCTLIFGCEGPSGSADDSIIQPQEQEKALDQEESSKVSSERNRDLEFEDIPAEAIISADQLRNLLTMDEPPFVLDIRAAGLARDAYIEGSKNIPAGRQLDLRLSEIPKDQLVAIVADGTARLAEVRQTLIDAGFNPENLIVVENAMDDWIAAGYPTLNRPQMGC